MTPAPSAEAPQGDLALRVYAMPQDTNPAGRIFGGWVLGQMDIGGSICASQAARGARVVTVAIDAMKFHKPIHVGDEVTIYTRVERLGRTSIAVEVETWVRRPTPTEWLRPMKVTDGRFTYVCVDSDGRPVEFPKG